MRTRPRFVAVRAARFTVLATLLGIAGACRASGPPRSSGAVVPTSSGGRLITREQIVQLNVLDAYAVVERLSGYRLTENDRGAVSVRQRRGQTSLTNSNADRPLLLIDGTQMSDFSMLRRIRTAEIEHIEIVPPAEATQRYGTSANGAGAIIVVTRARL